MTGEISIFGVFMPQLFALSIVALLLNHLFTRLLGMSGAYRLFNNRPIVDVTCFLVILWLLSWAFSLKGVA
jgi:hypothetical protein